jgi:hypothetical protein
MASPLLLSSCGGYLIVAHPSKTKIKSNPFEWKVKLMKFNEQELNFQDEIVISGIYNCIYILSDRTVQEGSYTECLCLANCTLLDVGLYPLCKYKDYCREDLVTTLESPNLPHCRYYLLTYCRNMPFLLWKDPNQPSYLIGYIDIWSDEKLFVKIGEFTAPGKSQGKIFGSTKVQHRRLDGDCFMDCHLQYNLQYNLLRPKRPQEIVLEIVLEMTPVS